jgi:hypothetical protein
MLTDVHLIYGTLLCHTKIQIKFQFGFDPLIFPKVIALGLRKILRIVGFLHICSQTYWLCLFVCLLVYNHTSNFSAIWWLSPLPVTGLQILAYARRSGP